MCLFVTRSDVVPITRRDPLLCIRMDRRPAWQCAQSLVLGSLGAQFTPWTSSTPLALGVAMSVCGAGSTLDLVCAMSTLGAARPNVLITGTPGTGKTQTAMAIAEAAGFRHVEVGRLVKDRGFHTGWNEEWQTYGTLLTSCSCNAANTVGFR